METVSALGLKRRFEEVDSGSPYSTPKDSDDDISSSDSADSCDSLNAPSSTLTPTSILRRHKPSLGRKRVRFDAVTVYYFSRRQGFTSVPSQGGSSLGMARHHCAIRQYTLAEFAREQETCHRLILRQHLRQEKLNARKLKLTRNGAVECEQADLLTLDDVSDEDLDVEGVEVDDCFFLQPLPTKRRRALLRASGIARIDAREKAELRAIRLSREECGCDCRLYCDPRHCGCSQAGIKCQVDRMSFPCGCSREGCGNAAGRIEFNPLRVRTHYLHTIMKLDLEKRRLLGVRPGEDPEDLPVSSPSPSLSSPLDSDVDLEVVEALNGGHLLLGVEEVCDSLERENETAVLHLQSAEEQERMREQEEQEVLLQGELASQTEVEAMEEVLLQGTFPGGATLLCIAENQEEGEEENQQEQQEEAQSLLKDPASLLYYQLGHVETEEALQTLPAPLQDEVTVLGGGEEGGDTESDGRIHATCRQDLAASPSVGIAPSPGPNPPGVEGAGGLPLSPDVVPPGGECLGRCLALEGEVLQLPPEV